MHAETTYCARCGAPLHHLVAAGSEASICADCHAAMAPHDEPEAHPPTHPHETLRELWYDLVGDVATFLGPHDAAPHDDSPRQPARRRARRTRPAA